jgi:beta-phosphoglucomutase
MLMAVIFDFNGVLIDDEPIHLKMIQKVLGDGGYSLDADDYYDNYLGFDDRDCFRNYYQRHNLPIKDGALEELVIRKGRYYREGIEEHITVFPGVKKLVSDLAKRLPLGIASGALRVEIDLILKRIGLKDHFQAIVSTEDVSRGKPDPEIYVKALSLLNQKAGESTIQPSECLVIEDSKEGIRAGRAAKMPCLAVANSHPAHELTDANAVVQSLEEVTPEFLGKLFFTPGK